MKQRSIKSVSTTTIQSNFPWTFVRIYANDSAGLYGTGECFFAPGLEAILRELAVLLIGEDFTATNRIIEKLRQASSGAGSLGGIIWNAISGIEAALYDLKGKYFGMPLYQLLGGRVADRARIYVDCHGDEALECLNTLLQPVVPEWQRDARVGKNATSGDAIEGACERAREVVAEGYDFLKFDLDVPGSIFSSPGGYGLNNRDQNWMVKLVAGIRQTVGNDIDLAFDAHWRYRAADIVWVAKEIEPFRLTWLEDPVPPSDRQGLSRLRGSAHVPIATGENLQLRSSFLELLSADLCDIATPDLQKAGGLSEGKYIAAIADLYNKPIALHMIGSPLALMTSVQFAVTLPNFLACEFHGLDVPFYWEMVEGGGEGWFEPGWGRPTEMPGIGVELNEEIGKSYVADGSRWFDAR